MLKAVVEHDLASFHGIGVGDVVLGQPIPFVHFERQTIRDKDKGRTRYDATLLQESGSESSTSSLRNRRTTRSYVIEASTVIAQVLQTPRRIWLMKCPYTVVDDDVHSSQVLWQCVQCSTSKREVHRVVPYIAPNLSRYIRHSFLVLGERLG